MKCNALIRSRDGYSSLIEKGLSDESISTLLQKGHTFTEILDGEWNPGEWRVIKAKLQWIEKQWIPKNKTYTKLGKR